MEVNARSHRNISRQYIRGFPFPGSPKFPRDNIQRALEYEPQEGDIILSTFPKSGTTWVQYILYYLLNGDTMPLPTMAEMRRIMPYMEAAGTEVAMRLPSPRVIKYHVPYHLVPKSPHAKYIYIIRNPYDVVVSYFHFLRNITFVDLEFEDFFDGFVSGDLIYGDYFDHVMSWYETRNYSNVLLLSYDKMKFNPRKGLMKIAKFLGDEYFDRLSEDESLVNNILKRTSFTFMKKHLNQPTHEDGNASQDDKKSTHSDESDDTETLPNFFREGTVGGWKSHLTQDQMERMNKRVMEKLSGTGILKFWHD